MHHRSYFFLWISENFSKQLFTKHLRVTVSEYSFHKLKIYNWIRWTVCDIE